MRLRTALIASLAVTSFALADAPAERKVLADFESMSDGDAIATAANSKPWRRFGEATADNVVATQDGPLAGKTSAMYPVFWPNRFAVVALSADPALDLSAEKNVSVLIRSSSDQTKTRAALSVSDGKTTFSSKKPQPLTDRPQTLTFALADLELVDGPRAPLADVLAKATSIGVKLTSDGSKYGEQVLLDDLAVSK